MHQEMPALTEAEITAFYWTPLDKSSGCWEWLGPRGGRKGGGTDYGHFMIYRDGRRIALKATRVALFLMYGATPDHACHHCDNPPCVRPSHIYAGDSRSNAADRRQHGFYVLPRPGSRPDHTRRLIGQIHERGGLSAGEWSEEVSSAYELARIEAADDLRSFTSRLAYGGRLPEMLS